MKEKEEPTATEKVIALIKEIEQKNPLNCTFAFLRIAEQLTCLYDKSIESNILSNKQELQKMIDEATTNIRKRKDTIGQLNDKIKEHENMIKEEKELTDQEDVLNEKYQQLQQRLDDIAVLKKKKAELDKPENDFAHLEEEVKQIKLDNDDFANNLFDMMNRVKVLLEPTNNALSEQLSQVREQSKANLNIIKNQKKDLLELLERQTLKTCSEELDKQLDYIIDEYNKYVVKINEIKKKLDEISEKHESQVKQYNDRFNIDKDIFGAVEDPKAFSRYVDEHLKSMEDVLNAFEGKIKELVEQRNSLPLPEIYKKQVTSHNNDSTNNPR